MIWSINEARGLRFYKIAPLRYPIWPPWPTPWNSTNHISMCRSRGGAGGLEHPLKNYKNIGFSNNTGPDPLKNRSYQASIQCWAIIDTPAKCHLMAFRWRADDGPLIVVLGSSLPSSKTQNKNTKKKKRLLSCTPSDKTFWIRAWCPLEPYFRLDRNFVVGTGAIWRFRIANIISFPYQWWPPYWPSLYFTSGVFTKIMLDWYETWTAYSQSWLNSIKYNVCLKIVLQQATLGSVTLKK